MESKQDKFLSKFDEQNANEYYGGKNNPYEAIKIINNLDLNFNRGNVLKYILRAGKKDANKEIEDLQKAKNYIDYEIERLKIMNPYLANVLKTKQERLCTQKLKN